MRFELDPRERAGAELRRLATGLMDETLRQLDDPALPPAETVHEARKAMKKLRGLLRLVRPAAPDLYRAENRALRDAAADLSALRDADAALETFDRVLDTAREHADPTASTAAGDRAQVSRTRPQQPMLSEADPAALASLRERLSDWRDEAHQRQGAPQARLADFREQLLAARARAADWCLPNAADDDSSFDQLGPGLKKTYKRGRKAMARAYADPGVAAFHDWRKRSKYLGYHLRLLRPGWPDLLQAQRAAVKDLSDLLGDDHDLAVLAELLGELRPETATAAERRAEALLRAEMRRQSESLRQRAQGVGQRVFAERPKALRRRIGIYWRQAAAAASTQELP
jgi:CHAD domain-containing protein